MTNELKFAKNLAKQAGKILMDGLERVRVEGSKEDRRDIVTNMDLESEEMIIESIKAKFPGHNIYSEECGEIKGKSDYTWIIDPLCGTKYYVAGVKLFLISIALWKKEEPLLGVVFLPALGDLYWAEKTAGAFCNGKKLKVSNVDKIKDSIVYFDIRDVNHLVTGDLDLVMKRLKLIIKNSYRFRTFGFGGAPCYIAQGAFDAYIDLTGKEDIRDLAAGIIIAQEAGATVTGLDGKYHGKDTGHIVISNGKIHGQLLNLLNNLN